MVNRSDMERKMASSEQGIKNGKKIYDWIIRNHPPLTWNLMAIKIGDYFLENEIDPFCIVNTTEFNASLVSKIDHFLREHRKSGLPDNLLDEL